MDNTVKLRGRLITPVKTLFAMNVIDRFLEYVKFDTQSDELTNLWPSTPGQMIFAQHLEKELQKLGLEDISLDENGYLMATLPANTDKPIATIGFIAHLDTSPDLSTRAATSFSMKRRASYFRPVSFPSSTTTRVRIS